MTLARSLATVCIIAFAACGPSEIEPPADAGAAEAPLFPADVSAWTEVRTCRLSIDHDLAYIRIVADPGAAEPYRGRVETFPAGATVLKIEFGDEGCNDVTGYAVMLKLSAGTDVEAGDWAWQHADSERNVDQPASPQRCVTCHRSCQAPPGYDWTCAEED